MFSYILPNNGNLVVKACLAEFFSSNANNPNVLVTGSMGHFQPLAHAKKKPYRRSESPPAVLGRACFAAYGRFSDERRTTAGKFWQGMTVHLSVLHKPGRHFPKQNTSGPFLLQHGQRLPLLVPTGSQGLGDCTYKRPWARVGGTLTGQAGPPTDIERSVTESLPWLCSPQHGTLHHKPKHSGYIRCYWKTQQGTTLQLN